MPSVEARNKMLVAARMGQSQDCPTPNLRVVLLRPLLSWRKVRWSWMAARGLTKSCEWGRMDPSEVRNWKSLRMNAMGGWEDGDSPG
jgi:hypothetical protein